MPGPFAPLIGTLIRAVIGGSARGAALRGGARAAAAQSFRKRTAKQVAQTAFAKPSPAGVITQPAAAVKPNIKNIFQTLTQRISQAAPKSGTQPTLSPGGHRLNIKAIEQRQRRESPFYGLMDKFKGMFSKPDAAKRDVAEAAKPDTTFARMWKEFRSKGREAAPTADSENRGISQGAAAAVKPELDFSRLMGLMGTPNAKQVLQETTVREHQEAAEAAKEKEKQTLVGKGMTLTKKGVFLVAKVTGALTLALFAVRKWTDSLVESRRELVIYNGQIAASIARLDIQKIQLGIRTASRTQESTVELSQSIVEFRASIQPMSEDLRSFTNFAFKWFIKMATIAAKIVDTLKELKGIGRIADLIEHNNLKQVDKIPTDKFLDQMKKAPQLDGQGPRERLNPLQ